MDIGWNINKHLPRVPKKRKLHINLRFFQFSWTGSATFGRASLRARGTGWGRLWDRVALLSAQGREKSGWRVSSVTGRRNPLLAATASAAECTASHGSSAPCPPPPLRLFVSSISSSMLPLFRFRFFAFGFVFSTTRRLWIVAARCPSRFRILSLLLLLLRSPMCQLLPLEHQPAAPWSGLCLLETGLAAALLALRLEGLCHSSVLGKHAVDSCGFWIWNLPMGSFGYHCPYRGHSFSRGAFSADIDVANTDN